MDCVDIIHIMCGYTCVLTHTYDVWILWIECMDGGMMFCTRGYSLTTGQNGVFIYICNIANGVLWERRMRMDAAVAVFGGATITPLVSSSLATNFRLCHLPSHHHRRSTSHLAAFRSASHLFTHSSSSNNSKPRVFLPRLVASLVHSTDFFFLVLALVIFLVIYIYYFCVCTGSGRNLYND